MRLRILFVVLTAGVLLAAPTAQAVQVPFDFFGSAGFGLLPGNEPGTVVSSAIGGEAGSGLIYDTDTNVLNFDYEFMGLTGGLADAASGMHFHLVAEGMDPLTTNGPIVFNLNSGTDPNVTLSTPTLPTDGSTTGGRVTGTAVFTETQEAELFASRYYLNIHSGQFGGGELRGNLVPIPEPGSVILIAVGCLASAPWWCRRFRRCAT